MLKVKPFIIIYLLKETSRLGPNAWVWTFGGGKKCRAGDAAVFHKPVSLYQNICVRKKKI